MHPLGHGCKGDESDEAASQQRQSLDCQKFLPNPSLAHGYTIRQKNILNSEYLMI